jgi:1,4-dihydroxy-2-naphthoate octaprenyltransferase
MQQNSQSVEHAWSVKAYAWYRAMRPKALTISIIPVAAGTILSDVGFNHIHWLLAFSALAFALCIQIGSHYINDAIDYQRGNDSPEKANKKMITSGFLNAKEVLYAGFLCLFLASLFGSYLAYHTGPLSIPIFAGAILCAYIYTGGPYPLSYCGIGDLFVLLFYGLIATGGSAYLQQGYVGWKPLLAGAQIGLIAMTLMSINNFRDYYQDGKIHKKTLAVRLGLTFARWQITLQMLLPFALNIIWYDEGYSLIAYLTSMNLPLVLNIIRGTWTYDPGKVHNRFFIEAAFVHMMFGALLIFGALVR